MSLKYLQFKEVNLADKFFDSLKKDYSEFQAWFLKKAENWAYIHQQDNNKEIDGFLYLKIEEGPVSDVVPMLNAARRVKVGTFKINAHGTKLGERFIKKIFDHATDANVEELYVTVFPEHANLIALLVRYGFTKVAEKHTENGTEDVMTRLLVWDQEKDRMKNYPLIKLDGAFYQIGIYPDYHTRLFPDSILNNEDVRVVKDVSHANSIKKIFLSRITGIMGIKPGDKIVIYRTGDGKGPAEYRAVATSLCVVEESRRIASFRSATDFVDYARAHSVFSDDELTSFYNEEKYLFALRFTYNVALRRRLTRNHLIENIGIDRNAYPGFTKLTREQFKKVAFDGGVNEGLTVD